MPVPRCDQCGRVLNANGSCVNELECANHLLSLLLECPRCGHKHWQPEEENPLDL